MELIFATNNSHKLQEVKKKLRTRRGEACLALVRPQIQIISLSEIGFSDEIPETGTTFHENALQKAQTIYDFCKSTFRQVPGADIEPIEVFADDSGLEIEALNGAPGVYSAMYAEKYRGDSGILRNTPNFDDNINLVLSQLRGKTNRRACFKSVIALILNDEIHYFEGRVDGEIITEKHGTEGFGYDPIFVPDGYKETFAELSQEEKNKISHRGRAVEKLVDYLSIV
jgi:XTP/dITP diphosphohydrolase